jgi:hypothetical protein
MRITETQLLQLIMILRDTLPYESSFGAMTHNGRKNLFISLIEQQNGEGRIYPKEEEDGKTSNSNS